MEIVILDASGEWVSIEIMDSVLQAAKLLPYAPERYFEITPSTLTLPITSLVQTRARQRGIDNAVSLMEAAYRGKQLRRAPISVRKIEADKYLVIDGNSTVTVARMAGWRDLPCAVLASA